MVSATRAPNNLTTLSLANGFHGLSRTSDRSILPSALLLQLRLSRLAILPTGRSSKQRLRMPRASERHRNFLRFSSTSTPCGRSCFPSPPPQLSAPFPPPRPPTPPPTRPNPSPPPALH